MTTPVLGTFCGQTSPPVLDSFGSNVRLVFHSDGNQQDLTGFVVRVTASIEGKHCSLILSQYITRPHSSECGGDIEGTEGSIQSPGYPNTFAHRHSCSWRIRVPLGRKVTLTFEDFDLEAPISYGNNSACRYDWLMVRTKHSLETGGEGGNKTLSLMLKTFTINLRSVQKSNSGRKKYMHYNLERK